MYRLRLGRSGHLDQSWVEQGTRLSTSAPYRTGCQDSWRSFHNGCDALEAVHQVHKSIKTSLRRDDQVTEKVFDVLITGALLGGYNRPSFMMLYGKARRILAKARQELQETHGVVARSCNLFFVYIIVLVYRRTNPQNDVQRKKA